MPYPNHCGRQISRMCIGTDYLNVPENPPQCLPEKINCSKEKERQTRSIVLAACLYFRLARVKPGFTRASAALQSSDGSLALLTLGLSIVRRSARLIMVDHEAGLQPNIAT